MRPKTLNEYLLYFWVERYVELLKQHLERWHRPDTFDMTLWYEWLEENTTF